ncbi:MAG: hypothetical protein GY703_07475 [Gammaproteobacteria bacterium]|nr:hypothetical protein [Gammaproteobacteria bacterium]
MDETERIIELLLEATSPRSEHPLGELDRMRAQQVSDWNRLHGAGMLDETELRKLIHGFDNALDYQRDHPLNEIDEILDSAISLVRNLNTDDRRAVSELLDDTVRSRVGTYMVRCASRALADKSVGMCETGLMAYLLIIDPRSDKTDPRDLMVSLAPLHVAAQGSNIDPATLFDQYAAFAPDHISKTLRDFGQRTDVTLEAFGWALSNNLPIRWIILSRKPGPDHNSC